MHAPEYAAAFFLLGGSLKDAVNVCLKNLSDWQLAVALARVVEQGDERESKLVRGRSLKPAAEKPAVEDAHAIGPALELMLRGRWNGEHV